MDHFAWERKRAVVFVTGMSGTGKSTALAELGKRGHRTVDTDLGGYSEQTDHDGKRPEERDEIIHYFHTVEPLLRQGASHEIDTNRPLHEVVTQLERISVASAK